MAVLVLEGSITASRKEAVNRLEIKVGFEPTYLLALFRSGCFYRANLFQSTLLFLVC